MKKYHLKKEVKISIMIIFAVIISLVILNVNNKKALNDCERAGYTRSYCNKVIK